MIIFLAGSIADRCAAAEQLKDYDFGTLHTFFDKAPKEVLKYKFPVKETPAKRRTKWIEQSPNP